MRELIVDSFAGGGGASTGIEMALGRSPDVAINHDAEALALHAANHPGTLHLCSNVWQVDPADVTKGRPLGLLWASPDCKHFSKAKGGKPVSRNIRDLAWVVTLWAERARPRVIILENVEEFQDWGPLVVREDGREFPCPDRKGETFKRFVGRLRKLGYRVEWRELRACDYGAPTIRKRLFLIARRDGRPIAWPAPTHGDPKSDAVRDERLKPWRTAAEIIDWSLPCPSIFDTSAEILARHGLRAKRPLAEATMARIARGVMRYVVNAAEPFIVSVAHGDSGGRREYPIDDPLGTTTGSGQEHALVTPFVSYGQQGGASRPADEPLHTVTASAKDTNAVVAPYLVPRYGERPGQEPRTRSVEEPASTIVPTGNGDQLAAALLVKNNFGDKPFSGADEPVRTICTGNNHLAVAAFLAQHNTGVVGHDARKPLSSIVAGGQFGQTQQAVVAAHMLNMKGSERQAYGADQPVKTLCARANHATLISSFLIKYYGQGIGAGLGEPMHTETTRDRFGLVTVTIAGEPYVLVDIGMRMLTPRERFLAQGFPPRYIIDRGPDGRPLSGEAQGRMCGNSVCPPLAAALVAANCADLAADAAAIGAVA